MKIYLQSYLLIFLTGVLLHFSPFGCSGNPGAGSGAGLSGLQGTVGSLENALPLPPPASGGQASPDGTVTTTPEMPNIEPCFTQKCMEQESAPPKPKEYRFSAERPYVVLVNSSPHSPLECGPEKTFITQWSADWNTGEIKGKILADPQNPPSSDDVQGPLQLVFINLGSTGGLSPNSPNALRPNYNYCSFGDLVADLNPHFAFPLPSQVVSVNPADLSFALPLKKNSQGDKPSHYDLYLVGVLKNNQTEGFSFLNTQDDLFSLVGNAYMAGLFKYLRSPPPPPGGSPPRPSGPIPTPKK